MGQEIIDKVREISRKAHMHENNKFKNAWETHTTKVVKYAKILGKKLDADLEVIEIAALLHDYASVYDFSLSKDHHIHGARMAEEILIKLDYPKEKIDAVKHCIYTHRGSMNLEKKTIEAKIVASADAMSHFDCIGPLLWVRYILEEMNIQEGIEDLRGKIQRSWNKLIPEAKEIMKEKYNAIMIVLNLEVFEE